MNETAPQSSQEKMLSDKIFWHGYIPFYETFFTGRTFKCVAEFGVYKGRSICWLMGVFILRTWIRGLESKYTNS